MFLELVAVDLPAISLSGALVGLEGTGKISWVWVSVWGLNAPSSEGVRSKGMGKGHVMWTG